MLPEDFGAGDGDDNNDEDDGADGMAVMMMMLMVRVVNWLLLNSCVFHLRRTKILTAWPWAFPGKNQ